MWAAAAVPSMLAATAAAPLTKPAVTPSGTTGAPATIATTSPLPEIIARPSTCTKPQLPAVPTCTAIPDDRDVVAAVVAHLVAT